MIAKTTDIAMDKSLTYNYVLEIADNCLILGQRMGERCGHGPSLEIDIACTNIALDLLGQVRSYYQYAAELLNDGKSEDDIAMLRKEHEYKNVLLVEQPNLDFAHIIARQYFFDAYHYLFLQELQNSTDEVLAAIAKKAIKEVSYHLRFSTDWLKRLGDGTQESRERMQKAIDTLWPYTGELFEESKDAMALIDSGVSVNPSAIKALYTTKITEELTEATLMLPDVEPYQYGGKTGVHSEHMGYILSELQYMQRTYPNMTW